jgi:putative ABC transport system substrate-binding protein
LQVERRYADGRPEAQQALAEELLRARVELIVANDSATALVVKRTTKTTPIIVYSAGDPVLSGLVATLARPGGNVTGVALASPEVTAKALSLLKKAVPGLQRIGYLTDAGNQFDRTSRAQVERVCRSLGLAPMMIELDSASDIGQAFRQLSEWRARALMWRQNLWSRRFEIVDGAMKLGLPTMAADADFVREVGALMSYSPSWAELCRLRATFIDRILRGAKPAELPVEQPTVYELVINLKTAQALGLKVPKELLLQASEVIQ